MQYSHLRWWGVATHLKLECNARKTSASKHCDQGTYKAGAMME